MQTIISTTMPLTLVTFSQQYNNVKEQIIAFLRSKTIGLTAEEMMGLMNSIQQLEEPKKEEEPKKKK